MSQGSVDIQHLSSTQQYVNSSKAGIEQTRSISTVSIDFATNEHALGSIACITGSICQWTH